MIDKVFEMAQEEYKKQYDEWLKLKPNQKSILDTYEKLKKLAEKYKKKTDKEKEM